MKDKKLHKEQIKTTVLHDFNITLRHAWESAIEDLLEAGYSEGEIHRSLNETSKYLYINCTPKRPTSDGETRLKP